MLFRVLWWFDLLIAGIVVYFFLVGLADGTVSSFNAGIWFLLLLGVSAVMIGSRVAQAAGRHKLAIAVALVLAVPGVLAALFMALVLLSNPRWN